MFCIVRTKTLKRLAAVPQILEERIDELERQYADLWKVLHSRRTKPKRDKNRKLRTPDGRSA